MKIVKIRNRTNKNSRCVKASFTIEAAIIVPVILFTILGGFNIGFDMFRQAGQAAQITDEIKELDPVKIVRRNTMIREFVDN